MDGGAASGGSHRRREKAFQLSVLRLKLGSSDRDLIFSGVLREMEQEIKDGTDAQKRGGGGGTKDQR